MSHVRRKNTRVPGRVAQKKSTKKQWRSFYILLVFLVSVIAGVLIVILSAPQ